MEVRLIGITKCLLEDGEDPELLIEYAARTCWRSHDKHTSPEDTARIIGTLLSRQHLSAIEHASATFEIRGISRACSHQLVRHRIASYSQESQRYVRVDELDYVTPASIADDQAALKPYRLIMEQAHEVYRTLLSLGVAPQDARFCLPNATTTNLVATFNFREMLHIFKLRISPQAQWEIRDVAVRMLELVYPIAPAVFGDIREELRAKYPSLFEGMDHA